MLFLGELNYLSGIDKAWLSTAEDSAKGFDRVLFTARKALYQMIRQAKLAKGPAK